jgi:DNA-binding LytR/AlgR family response regulator
MKSYKIYVVEDMGVTRASLINILETNKHIAVGSSATAEKAWFEIQDLKPDLVLLDLNLKGNKTGLWLAKKIRSHLNIPFIFITAYGSNEIVDRITEVKSDGYIMKPFNKSTLLANIQLAVANFDKNKSTAHIANTQYYLLKTKNGIRKIKVNDIKYLQSQGNYVNVFLEEEQLVTRFKLDDLLNVLNTKIIQKVHLRYAVNTNKINKIDKQDVFIDDVKIPVSKTFLFKIIALLAPFKNLR